MSDELGKTPEDIRAKERNDLWVQMGFPPAPNYMEEETYQKEFLGRVVFRSMSAMAQYQMLCKVLMCGACLETKPNGMLAATRLFIEIGGDIMTVFKAMGHAVCHRCGFEEYYPMVEDPRPKWQQAQYAANRNPYAPYAAIGSAIGTSAMGLQQAIGSPTQGLKR